MKKLPRLELYGVSEETKRDLKVLSRAHGISSGRLVEPLLRKYVDRPENRRLIRRNGD